MTQRAISSLGRTIQNEELASAILSGAVDVRVLTPTGQTLTADQLGDVIDINDGNSWQGAWNSGADYEAGAVVSFDGKIYRSLTDVDADGDEPDINGAWTLAFDPGEAPPALNDDSGSPIVRAVTTDARDAVSATPTAPVFLAMVDIGSWQQPDDVDAFFTFTWEENTVADPTDSGWAATANFSDAGIMHATSAGHYYRLRVRLTNDTGYDEATSNVIGPLG